MNLLVNGDTRHLPDAITVTELLDQLGYADRKVAVAINQTFVPRAAYGVTTLHDRDDVEIVAPMPGG